MKLIKIDNLPQWETAYSNTRGIENHEDIPTELMHGLHRRLWYYMRRRIRPLWVYGPRMDDKRIYTGYII